ncbi:MAG TPA: hypothetical protein VFJ14_17330 [Nocardioidaceae bacterium]|nr:hypothetical protein [Nocardioidaceae bacterium]
MYDVVLLIEKALSKLDAEQVVSLHEELDDTVHYHVILPVEDAATRIETALGSIAASEVLATSAMNFPETDLDELEREIRTESEAQLATSMDLLRGARHQVTGELTSQDPVDALAVGVEAQGAEEAIVMTRPHVVSEFFHFDWTSKARRRIGVPCLHLLERETFDEQAGSGEGVTGM